MRDRSLISTGAKATLGISGALHQGPSGIASPSLQRAPTPAKRSRMLLGAWLGWAVFIVYGSLLPFDFTPMPLLQAWSRFQATPFFHLGVEQRADWVANGVLYLPMGWLTAVLFARAQSHGRQFFLLLTALAACLALDVGVEFAQLFFPPRTVSLNDVWAEAIGSALGVVAAPPMSYWWTQRAADSGSFRWDRRLLDVYLLAYLAFCLFPYDLLLSADELRQKFRSGNLGWFIASTDAGLVRVSFQLAAETVLALPFGVWLAIHSKARDGNARDGFGLGAAVAAGLALGLVIEGAQLFIESGISQGASVLTRAVGVPLGVALWQRRDGWPRAVRALQRPFSVRLLFLVYVLGLIVANGWLSAAWHGAAGARESWASVRFMPLYYHYYTTEALALFSLASVALMYAPVGVLTWLRRSTPAGAAVAALLLCAVVEIGKLFIDGARPDPTNLWIAAVSAWLVHRAAHAMARARRPITPNASQPAVKAPAVVASGTSPWKVLWALSVVYGLVAAAAFPVVPVALAALLAACAGAIWWRPALAPIIVLTAMPVLDLAPWSGRIYWDEFDLLLTVCLGAVLLRLPPSARRGQTDGWFRAATVMLLLSLAISTARALWPLQMPDDRAFYGYFSPYNALRIVKGAAWAVATIAVLRRLVAQGVDIGAGIVGGMTTGLALTVLVALWERWAFVGLFDVASDYRATGPFSAMHTGGAYIECYLAMAAPFALSLAIGAKRRIVKAAAAAVVMGASAAVMLTFARNGWVALLLGATVFLGLLIRRSGRTPRDVAAAASIAAAAVVLAIPILLGPFAHERMSRWQDDLQIRRAHWSDALALRDRGLATSLFGMGIGRFPETHYWRSSEPQHAATFGVATEGANRYLRLGTGAPLYLEQIVDAEPGTPYDLTLRMRSNPPSTLTVSLCEKWMLTSARCSSARFTPVSSAWNTMRAQLLVDPSVPGSSTHWKPMKLALHAPAQGAVIEVDDVRLQDSEGRELLQNGGFESRLDRWFFTTDVDSPWHIHNLALTVLFDQGWFGVVAWSVFLLVALWRGAMRARSGHLVQLAAVSSLMAFAASGSLNDLIDAPRFLWLVMVASWVATRPQDRVGMPARTAGTGG